MLFQKTAVLTSALFVFAIGGPSLVADAADVNGHRVYAHLLEPSDHPDYARRAVKPPTWETFGNQTQFATLRGFGVENEMVVKYVEEIDKYTKTFDLGRVLWPSYPIVFAKNLNELADEIKRRDLFLFDIWGYVPGSGPGDYWQQYKPSKEALTVLESTLGDHWLGMDVGEQDGRYIGGYAGQMFPISANRFEQYLNFQRHFERMGNELGNKLSTLVSLNFGHYFLKEGTYTTIGAETAQGLPNGQVYYAFIRGAGKQYGVPWFGNASVWNRWGYKSYGGTGDDHGPTKGTSLNLLKRLMYNHILYNCVFVGFESAWFDGDQLSPVGQIQQAAQKWVREQGQPGVMMTPVALLFDFYSGWTFPRHLYSSDIYRVWGNVPYEPGDYLADGVLDMLYPGYQDSSYFHDESGFISPTPYGDIADCLLSDAPSWVLDRYPLVIAVTELTGGRELADKLNGYVEAGGHLVISGGNLAKFPEGLCGIKAGSERKKLAAGSTINVEGNAVLESPEFVVHPLEYPGETTVLADCAGQPLAVERKQGNGTITVLASSFGVPEKPVVDGPIASNIDASLPKPYPLLNHVRTILDKAVREQALFETAPGLSLIVCRKEPGVYTLGICNNSLILSSLPITSHCGPIESITELPLDQSEKGAAGYLPEAFQQAAIGVSSEGIIAGGDVRVFEVRVREEGFTEIPHVVPPRRPTGRILPLSGLRMLKEQILARPTFFEHFDSVSVDWRYLYDRDSRALKEESEWLRRQGVRIYVDLASGINLYPDLRLINNDPAEYEASMAVVDDVLAKMESLGSRDLLLTPTRQPENSFSSEQTANSFVETLREVCSRAAARSVNVYLRVSTKFRAGLDTNAQFVKQVAAPNLLLAPSIALLEHQKLTLDSIPEDVKSLIGLWLVSAPEYDPSGKLWTCSAPATRLADPASVSKWTSLAPDKPILFDAVYANQDEEYCDAMLVGN